MYSALPKRIAGKKFELCFFPFTFVLKDDEKKGSNFFPAILFGRALYNANKTSMHTDTPNLEQFL
jgi:hypothetical protein